MIEPQEDLKIVVRGEEVVIPKEDYYFAEDGKTPVLYHPPLKKLAEKYGAYVERVELEFPPIMTPEGIPIVAHRAYGRDEKGREISAVGEAGPYNLDGLAVNYPVIMSNKRAEDRLLIALLGLEGKIYSEFEISPNQPSGQTSTSVFPFGKHKGKTLEQIKEEDKQYLEWFTTKYVPKSPRDRELQEKAKEVLASS